MGIDAAKLHEFALRYTAAWCSQDPASVASFFSPNAALTVNDGIPARGRAEIAELARSFMNAFPDLKVTMDDLVIQGDRIEYHWTLSGSNKGLGGSGHRVLISGFEKWRIGEDDLIADSQGHFDAVEYERQVQHGI